MKRFSNSALKKAKTFDVNHLTKQIINVYEQAIQAKKEDLYVTLRAEGNPTQEAVSST
jgi:DNA-binding phage protein